MIYLFINGTSITALLHIIQPLNWGFDELQWNFQVMWAEKGTLRNEWDNESTDRYISSTAYCLFHICTRTMMNTPQPVIVTSPVVQGQQVQQGMTSQPQVVYMQAPSSPQLQMENSQRGCIVGMGVMQLIIGIFIFLAQISAFIIFTTLTTYAAPGTWSGIFVSICIRL